MNYDIYYRHIIGAPWVKQAETAASKSIAYNHAARLLHGMPEAYISDASQRGVTLLMANNGVAQGNPYAQVLLDGRKDRTTVPWTPRVSASRCPKCRGPKLARAPQCGECAMKALGF